MSSTGVEKIFNFFNEIYTTLFEKDQMIIHLNSNALKLVMENWMFN